MLPACGGAWRFGRCGSCCGRPFARGLLPACLIAVCRRDGSIRLGNPGPRVAIDRASQIPQRTRRGLVSVDPSSAACWGSFRHCVRDILVSRLGFVLVRSSSSNSCGRRGRRLSGGRVRCGTARGRGRHLLCTRLDLRGHPCRGGVRLEIACLLSAANPCTARSAWSGGDQFLCRRILRPKQMGTGLGPLSAVVAKTQLIFGFNRCTLASRAGRTKASAPKQDYLAKYFSSRMRLWWSSWPAVRYAMARTLTSALFATPRRVQAGSSRLR